MNDLISRPAAIDALAELQGRASTKAEFKGISKAWKRIRQLPPIQPEIIRCQNCENYQENFHWCKLHDGEFSLTDFCSYAERREDG